MKVFNELIKSFDKIRDYTRDFAVYGYKRREDFKHKSFRTYDNERRRIQSYLSHAIHDQTCSKGKRLWIHFDSMHITSNPLFEVLKTKSFTKNDVMLHFILLDILKSHTKLTLTEITSIIFSDYLIHFESEKSLDVRTVRIKTDEYVKLGLLTCEKNSKKTYYFLSPCILNELQEAVTHRLFHALSFFQNIAPVGILGHFILEKKLMLPNHFAFRDLHFTHTLDDTIMLVLFEAIQNHTKVEIIHPSLSKNYVLPLKIVDNVGQGRRYVMVYHYRLNKYKFYRLDKIKQVILQDSTDDTFNVKFSIISALIDKSWGVALNNTLSAPLLEKWTLTLSINEETEKYLLDQIKRENKDAILQKLTKNTYLYTVSVLDANEMTPWLRGFMGRILDIDCTNEEVLSRFINDIKLMKSYYEEPEYGII